MPDPAIPTPAETAARLQAILDERKALHADEYKRLNHFQRAYTSVGMAVPMAGKKPRKKAAATPLLDTAAQPKPATEQPDANLGPTLASTTVAHFGEPKRRHANGAN